MAPAWCVHGDSWKGHRYAYGEKALGTGKVVTLARLVGRSENARRLPFSTHKQADKQTSSGESRQVLTPYKDMRRNAVQASPRTFVALLKECIRLHDLETAKQIHSEVVKHDCELDLYVGTMLVHVYTKCRSLEAARDVFDRMPTRDVVSWTAMILGYAELGRGEEALQLYSRMQQGGVVPDSRTYVAVLKACKALADLEKRGGRHGKCLQHGCLETVRGIHADAVKGKLESDVFVGNMLVEVYTKCGSLEEARRVFDNIPRRNLVSWNAMILGCVQMDKSVEALQLYNVMQQEGMVPDSRTCVGALRACSKLAKGNEAGDAVVKARCLEIVKVIHAHTSKWSNVFVETMLVDAYANCGRLEDARHVFKMMARRDVVSWTAMIMGCAQSNKGDEALQLFQEMQLEGVVPDGRIYVGVLRACSSLAELEHTEEGGDLKTLKRRCLNTARNIHADIRTRKLESDVYVANMLVDVYSKCRSMEDARRVFEGMPHHDVASWNFMILGYAQVDEAEEAIQLYTEMKQEGVMPDSRTYVSVLKACSCVADKEDRSKCSDSTVLKDKCLEIIKAIHASVAAREIEMNLFLGSLLVDVYAKFGCLEGAREVFDHMPCRNVVCWNALIMGYAQMSKGEEALQLYMQMLQENVEPDSRTYVSALKACSSLADSADKNEDECSTRKEWCLKTVRDIHVAVADTQIEANVFVQTMLVDAYAKCGSLEDASRVFYSMSYRDVVSWSAMIVACAQLNQNENALRLYSQMGQEGVVPDGWTYVGALNACGNLAWLEKGKEIHAQIVKAGEKAVNLFVMDSLVDMYAKCGSMASAQQVFDAMSPRGTLAWNSLIAGYAHQGDSESVFNLLHIMKDEGVQPDGITFLGVLTACSHAGRVDSGQKYFQAMNRDYGITPTIKHITCMVDLLGRAGHLDKAMQLVDVMPFQPTTAVWKCIMNACRKWGNVQLARRAFESAVGTTT